MRIERVAVQAEVDCGIGYDQGESVVWRTQCAFYGIIPSSKYENQSFQPASFFESLSIIIVFSFRRYGAGARWRSRAYNVKNWC
jgi:hypothetical protein